LIQQPVKPGWQNQVICRLNHSVTGPISSRSGTRALSETGRAGASMHRVVAAAQFKGNTMTDQEINEYYDSHLNMTLAELSKMTGKTIAELKKIIMGPQ
jgi:hypothetical protein